MRNTVILPPQFIEKPLVGILRGIEQQHISGIAHAAINAQLSAIEITMNTPNAGNLIAEMKQTAAGQLWIGAGTVLTLSQLHDARAAGAEFIVMPVIVPEVIRFCADKNIAVFPGALTPSEIHLAWSLGATMVKVFPASCFGPGYFKEVKAPLNHVQLLACGGVSVSTIKSYFENGASAAAFGASVFKKEWIEAGEYYKISNEIKLLIAAMS